MNRDTVPLRRRNHLRIQESLRSFSFSRYVLSGKFHSLPSWKTFCWRCSARVVCALPLTGRTRQVQKCRYCVKEGDPLRTVMKDYFVDTNWLKIWTLNNGLHSTLGTECLPGLDCDQNVGSLVAIDNPQLVLGTPSGTGKRILWTG